MLRGKGINRGTIWYLVTIQEWTEWTIPARLWRLCTQFGSVSWRIGIDCHGSASESAACTTTSPVSPGYHQRAWPCQRTPVPKRLAECENGNRETKWNEMKQKMKQVENQGDRKKRKIQKESRLRNNDQFSKLSNSWSEKGSGYVLPSSPRPSPVASPLHSSPCATHCCPRIGVPFKLARQCCRQQSVAVLCEPAWNSNGREDITTFLQIIHNCSFKLHHGLTGTSIIDFGGSTPALPESGDCHAWGCSLAAESSIDTPAVRATGCRRCIPT